MSDTPPPTEDGGPAFPFVEPPTTCNVCAGMTLRDYFAGAALIGLLSNPEVRAGYPLAQDTAKISYEISDAMLAIRGKAGA